ncbi:hypothetical protein FHX03_006461 [Rhizobium sp. BK456]|nr:hypothetical protein [Rhizobium sp. BK456]
MHSEPSSVTDEWEMVHTIHRSGARSTTISLTTISLRSRLSGRNSSDVAGLEAFTHLKG